MKFSDQRHGERMGIREVYYDEAGKPSAYVENAARVIQDTIDELRATLIRMQEALDKPILTTADFEDPAIGDDATAKRQS